MNVRNRSLIVGALAGWIGLVVVFLAVVVFFEVRSNVVGSSAPVVAPTVASSSSPSSTYIDDLEWACAQQWHDVYPGVGFPDEGDPRLTTLNQCAALIDYVTEEGR